jgi:alkylation response protein AidB-like acyl-CoA dehydrogenase
MDFRHHQDIEELRSMTARWLEPISSSECLLKAQKNASGYDPKAWRELGELGLCSLLIDEVYDGTAMGMEAMSALCSLFGEHLLASPFFAHAILACDLLNQSSALHLKQQHLSQWALGSCIATVALNGSGRWDGSQLSGSWSYVPHGGEADLIITQARDQEGSTVLLLVPQSEFIWSAQHGLDQSRQHAHLKASDLRIDEAALIAHGDAAESLITFTHHRSLVALAHEQIGIAQACTLASVEYAKTRKQFGEYIGRFQAVKHLIADMYTELEAARSAAIYATWCADHDTSHLPFAALTAAQLAGTAGFHCAGQNIQIHGGIGFTWEHPAHLYFKRAKANQTLLGSSIDHLDQAAHLLDLDAR